MIDSIFKRRILPDNGRFFILAFFVFKMLFPNCVKAETKTYTSSLKGPQVVVGAVLNNKDSKFPDPYNSNWKVAESIRDQKVINRIALRIDTSSTVYQSQNFTCAIVFGIKSTDEKGKESTFDSETLTVSFDGTAKAIQVDQHVFQFEDQHKVEATIKSMVVVGLPPGESPGNLLVENSISVERYYQFDLNATLPSLTLETLVNNELQVSWPAITGAEEYELEWLHVSDYDGLTTTGDASSGDLDFDFSLNSSRITHTALSYTITNIFEKGYVLFRYRGIGRDGVSNRMPVIGKWSCDGSCSGKVADYADKIKVGAHESDKFNWEYEATYSEEGKKKELVSYFDGTLRNRQSVSKLNTENQSIVGETIYDHQGRAAINVMPTPTGQPVIKYFPNYNQNIAGKPYSRDDFDKKDSDPLVGACSLVAAPMSTVSGSSYYYSQSNSNKTKQQGYLPDASGFPFSQVEYTPDNTGRIRRQGGVGPDHQLSRLMAPLQNETQYFYGKPSQEHLDRMFGSEVGSFSHYNKNMIRDPNGQLQVSYLDYKGRTIATALAGNHPANLNPIPSVLSEMEINILDNLPAPLESKVLQSSYNYLAAVDGVHTFNYAAMASNFTGMDCDMKDICYDCVYDLTISIKNECGEELATSLHEPLTKTIGKLNNLNSICEDPKESYETTFTVPLVTGSYLISKTLKINQGAYDFYKNDYFNNTQCPKNLIDIIVTKINETDFSRCEKTDCRTQCLESVKRSEYPTQAEYLLAIETCKLECNYTDPCAYGYSSMISDMSPGGQYATYTTDAATGKISSTDKTSILTANSYLFPFPFRYLTMYDENNIPDTIYLPNGDRVRPDSLLSLDSLNEFIRQWKPIWGRSIVQWHPEYCYYNWCEKNKQSNKFDFLMRNIDSYEDALKLGLLNPLKMPQNNNKDELEFNYNIPVPGTGGTGPLPISPNNGITYYNEDPFFTYSFGSDYRPRMIDSIYNCTFIATVDEGGVPVVKVFKGSMWKIAILLAHCNNAAYNGEQVKNCAENYILYPADDVEPCSSDRVWNFFRTIYLTKKQQIVDWVRDNSSAGCNYDNINIGKSGNYQNNTPRFSSVEAIFAKEGINNIYDSNVDNVKSVSESKANKKDSNPCELFADGWMETLKGCNPSGEEWKPETARYDSLRKKLILICSVGIDQKHPFGASTVPPGHAGILSYKPGVPNYQSFDDAILDVVGTLTFTCKADLITEPKPYEYIPPLQVSKTDVCACNTLISVNEEYTSLRNSNSLPPGISTKDEYFEFYFKDMFPLNEINGSLCICNKALALGSGTWTPAGIKLLQDSGKYVPGHLLCEVCSDCITVSTLASDYKTEIESEFGPITAANQAKFDRMLVNHLNTKLGMDKSLAEFREFIATCSKPGLTCTKITKAAQDLEKLIITLKEGSNDLLTSACLCKDPYVLPNRHIFSYTDILAKLVDPSFNLSTCDYVYQFDRIDQDKLYGKIVSLRNPATTLCTIDLTFVETNKFKFSNIVTFSNLRVDPLSVGTNFHFLIDAKVINGNNQSVETTLKGKTSCIPIADCVNNNMGKLCNVQPDLPIDNCVPHQIDIVIVNSQFTYRSYIETMKNEFETGYISTCKAVKNNENFTMKYTDGEYHYTLYYYDQAGNLVRTVPPEGVELVKSQEDLDQIANDRLNHTRTYFTKHRMATTYQYNSLNQLESQSMPDHSDFNDWKVKPLTNGLPSGLNIIGTQLTEGNEGYLIADDVIDPDKSRIYYMEKGTDKWTLINSFGSHDLNEIQFFGDFTGYAVGGPEILFKSTDGGVTWVVKSTTITDDAIGLYFSSVSSGLLFTKTGRLFRTTDGGNAWTELTSDNTNLKLDEIKEVQFNNNGSIGVAVGRVGTDGAIFRTTDGGENWEEQIDVRTSDLKSVQFLTESNSVSHGFAVGADGTLLKTTSNGEFWNKVSTTAIQGFKKIYFSDDLHGTAILSDGKLYYTDTGGRDWTLKRNYDFADFYFRNSQTGYAVAKNGYVFSTNNSGATWSSYFSLPAGTYPTTLFFENGINAFTGGQQGKIWKLLFTSPSFSWVEITPSGTTEDIAKIHSNGVKICAVLSNGTIQYSPNNGVNLVDKSPTSDTYKELYFRNANNGYALAGNGVIAVTNNAGETWAEMANHPYTALNNLNSIYFSADGKNGYVVGDRGQIFTTADYGTNWEDHSGKIVLPMLNGVHIDPSNVTYVVGVGGALFKNNNGDAHWNTLNTGHANNFNDVFISGSNSDGVIVGDNGKIIYSSNAASNQLWDNVSIAGESGELSDVRFNNTNGFITSKSGRILSSNNNGAGWGVYYVGNIPLNGLCLFGSSGFAVGNTSTIIHLGGIPLVGTAFNPSRLNSSFRNAELAYAVGPNGAILKSSNSGREWSVLNSQTTAALRSVHFASPSQVVVVGNNIVKHSTDGGVSWLSSNTAITQQLNDVFMLDASNGYAVGNAGYIIKTTDGGVNWTVINPSPTVRNLTAIHIVSPVGYIAGASGTILKCDDVLAANPVWNALLAPGNEDWVKYTTSNSNIQLNDVYFRDFTTGYVIGNSGTILKTIDGGIRWQKEDNSNSSVNLNQINAVDAGHLIINGTQTTVNELADGKDRFSTHFYYDIMGRMVASQNSKQFKMTPPRFSYVKYDLQGRIVEAGELESSIEEPDPAILNSPLFPDNWSNSRHDVVRSIYDTPVADDISGIFGPAGQQNLRSRIATIATNKDYNPLINAANAYDYATHYNYDVHGNVKTLIQDQPKKP